MDIDIKNGSGYIAGSNPRSILMGVYKYLKSADINTVSESQIIPIILGEDEQKQNLVTIKNMETGEQEILTIEEIDDITIKPINASKKVPNSKPKINLNTFINTPNIDTINLLKESLK